MVRRFALPALVLALGLLAAHALRGQIARSVQGHVDARAADVQGSVEQRFGEYDEVLYSLRGLVEGSEHVSPAELRRSLAALEIDRRFPAVEHAGIGTPRRPATGREVRVVLTVPGRGQVYADLRADVVMHEVSEGYPNRPWLTLADDAGPVFASDGAPRRPMAVRRFYAVGRHWTVGLTPRFELRSPTERLAPWLVILGAALLALLVGWLAHSLAVTHRRARALAGDMTSDLRASEAALARSNAELERFAYVASHDLREPLRNVASFVGLLARRRGGDLDREAREWVEHAVRGTQRMQSVISGLLEYSRVGREDHATGVADLGEAYAAARRSLSGAIEAARADVGADELPTVALPPAEAERLLSQLLANALEHRGDARPVVRVESERDGDFWEVAVQDNGAGIDPRHHERVFALFQRLRPRDEREATGLGLALCRKIVELRGGSIRVESALGRGARFIVRLPAAEAV